MGGISPIRSYQRRVCAVRPVKATPSLTAYLSWPSGRRCRGGGTPQPRVPVLGPVGWTVRHLLAHTSGLAFDEHRVTSAPGERRLYSNAGFEVLGDHVAKATDIPFGEYLRQAVLEPLGMTRTSLDGSPAKDGVS